MNGEKNAASVNDDNKKISQSDMSPEDVVKYMAKKQMERAGESEDEREIVSKEKPASKGKEKNKSVVPEKTEESEKNISEGASAEKPAEVKKAETTPTPEKTEKEVEEKKVFPEVPETPAKKTEQLEAELKDAREKYAEAHYGASSKISRIKRMLPFTKTDVGDIEDVNRPYQEYKQTMLKLIDSQLGDLKERKDLSPEELKKEMGDLVKRYNLGEKISLFEARTNARAEARKGEIGERLLNISAKAINGYRKLNWKYKLALSAGLFATGLGLGAIGAGTAAGMTILAKRGFSSAVLGTSATTGLEAVYRRGEGKKSEKAKKEALESIEEKDKDVLRFVELQKILNDQVEVCNEALSKELKSAKNRKLLGVVLGVAVGAFALPSIMKYFAGGAEHVAGAGGAAREALEQKAVHVAGMTVEKGSSIEGALIKQLMSEGIGKEEAGGMAHRMAVDYAKDNNLEKGMYNLVQPGTQIEYDKATHKILNVGSKDKMSWFAEKPEIGTPSGALAEVIPGSETHVEVLADNQLGWDNMSKAMHKELAGAYGSKIDELHKHYETFLRAENEFKFLQNQIKDISDNNMDGWNADDLERVKILENKADAWQKMAQSELIQCNNQKAIFSEMWLNITKGSGYSVQDLDTMKVKDLLSLKELESSGNAKKMFNRLRVLIKILKIDVGNKTFRDVAIEVSGKLTRGGFPRLMEK